MVKMRVEKKYIKKGFLGSYHLKIVMDGEPDFVNKMIKAIDKETKDWDEIEEV